MNAQEQEICRAPHGLYQVVQHDPSDGQFPTRDGEPLQYTEVWPTLDQKTSAELAVTRVYGPEGHSIPHERFRPFRRAG